MRIRSLFISVYKYFRLSRCVFSLAIVVVVVVFFYCLLFHGITFCFVCGLRNIKATDIIYFFRFYLPNMRDIVRKRKKRRKKTTTRNVRLAFVRICVHHQQLGISIMTKKNSFFNIRIFTYTQQKVQCVRKRPFKCIRPIREIH